MPDEQNEMPKITLSEALPGFTLRVASHLPVHLYVKYDL